MQEAVMPTRFCQHVSCLSHGFAGPVVHLLLAGGLHGTCGPCLAGQWRLTTVLFQAVGLLFQSGQPTPATPPWPLKLNCLFGAFCGANSGALVGKTAQQWANSQGLQWPFH